MGKERIVRRTVEAEECERKTKGRPRITWMDNVENFGEKNGKTIGEMNKIT